MIYALRGNTINDIALPLQLLTVEETSQTVTDYYPEPTDAICVRMVSTAYIEPMEVSVDGKYLHWAWTPEVTGTYGIEVRISKADGTHMRSYRKQQIRVYNSNDQMPEDDGTVEFISEYLVLDAVAVVWVKGDPGVGISSIDKTSTEGLVDTYTITFTDSSTTTFTVTNGQDATLNPEQIQQIIDEVIAEIDIPTKTSELTNDSGFITTEVDPTVPAWAKADSKPSYTATEVGAVPTTRKVNGKVLSADITLSASDVNALPSSTVIPTKTSDLTNDSGYITTYTETDPVFTASPAYSITSSDISSWNGKGTYSKPSGGIPKSDLASAVQTSLGKADTSLQPSDVIDSLSSASTTAALSANQGKVLNDGKQDKIDNSHKLSADLVDDTSTTNKFVTSSEKSTWSGKQDALVSGTNIKTINNESLLGSGNITIQGGGGGSIPIVEQTASVVEINPNEFNHWGEMASLTITLETPEDETILNEYMIQFDSGSIATTLFLPLGVFWDTNNGTLGVSPNKTYFIKLRSTSQGILAKYESYAIGLPQEAVLVEYIAGTGATCEIDSLIVPSVNTKIQIGVLNESSGTVDYIFWDNGSSSDNNDFRGLTYEYVARFDWVAGRISAGAGTMSPNVRYDYEYGNYYIKDLSSGTTIASGSTVGSYSASGTISIWGNSGRIIQRVYFAKIYDNDVLVRDFIPVRIGQTGYLYDRVSKSLFANKGTGTFTIGNDI